MVKYSTMTGKLKGIDALNSNPLTNTFCQSMGKNPANICHDCYSCAMLHTSRQNCIPRFENNGIELSRGLMDTFPGIQTPLFRINAHGELLNVNHTRNIIRLARANPNTTIVLWTKRPNLVYRALDLENGLPDNIVLVYSSKRINVVEKLPRLFHHVFTVYNYYNYQINCGRKSCLDCQLCYSRDTEVYINELLK